MISSRTRRPISWACMITVLRVMPARMLLEVGGVTSSPLMTAKMFCPEPSLTNPWTSSAIAST